MRTEYAVALEGLLPDDILAGEGDRVKRNALRAVNYAAERARTRSAAEMRKQVNFPASYLRGADSRLTVKTAKAFGQDAVITGQFRPTSLARFATRGKRINAKASAVSRLEVESGHPITGDKVKRMFLISFPAGRGNTDTKDNLLLAIRLKPGESVRNKKVQLKPAGGGLYFLHGPSVNQVFRSVAEDQLPLVEDDLLNEFTRLMKAGV